MHLSELRALAQWCKFGDTLDDMLRDRLVCGVNEETIQRRLLAESGLTLKKALEIAQGLEAAARNVGGTLNEARRTHEYSWTFPDRRSP